MDTFLLVFVALLIYVLFLFIIRHLEIGNKKTCANCNNCCPDCNLALNRIKRVLKDRIMYHVTFRIFDTKRYVCNECGWEGLRWEDQFKPGGN